MNKMTKDNITLQKGLVILEAEMESFRSEGSAMRFDIMIGGRYNRTFTFSCQAGMDYTSNDLKAYVKLKYPSLANKDFEVKYCGKPTFRN